MTTIQDVVCGVIPFHMLEQVARDSTVEASENARATLAHMRELTAGTPHTLLPSGGEARPQAACLHVYDAERSFELPGRLVLPYCDSPCLQAREAWNGGGATLDFYERVLGRRSIDDRGMRLDATVHYGTRFDNAMWNGRQMVYGDGDGRIFQRFTRSLDVIAHELTHGVIQHSAALGYSGQTGALNEHLADAFGIMVKQYALGQSAEASDWRIGAELFGPDAEGCAVRSLAFPGSAYDHPILGRDPQPSHMDDYVCTDADNGGVHINSGILNRAFYLAAMAIGGYTWEVLAKIWYAALIDRLRPEADFADFTQATIDIAGEIYGRGGKVQRKVIAAWTDVGLHAPAPFGPEARRRRKAA